MSTIRSPLNAPERRAVFSLSSIFALRMLGLFLILPVLSVFARSMPGTTPALTGLAVGIYGLTQAIFQIPFGYLSDRFGRKRIITIGLLVFMAGSVVAAMSDSIYGVILGRALQGAGAVAAAVLALIADLTREHQRTKAMAAIGVSIGLSFLVALMAAPILEGWIGVEGIFWLIATLPALMLPILWWFTPNPVRARRDAEVMFDLGLFRRILREPQIMQMNVGIFALHFAITSFFVVVPMQLVDAVGMPSHDHWKIYIPVLLLSVLGMVPLLIYAHRRQGYRAVMMASIVLMAAAEVTFGAIHPGIFVIAFALWLFFVGFNALEAILPALISRLAPAGTKGTVLGVYNTFEFAGIFAGGLTGGWSYGVFGPVGAYFAAAGVLALWFALVVALPAPRLLDSVTLTWHGRGSDGTRADGLLERLTSLPGVEDGTAVPAEGLVYLKVDPTAFDPSSIDRFPELTRN